MYNKIKSDFSKINFLPRRIPRVKGIIKIPEDKYIKYLLFSSGDFKNKFILAGVFLKAPEHIFGFRRMLCESFCCVNKGGR
jgi:hypothetical protein